MILSAGIGLEPVRISQNDMFYIPGAWQSTKGLVHPPRACQLLRYVWIVLHFSDWGHASRHRIHSCSGPWATPSLTSSVCTNVCLCCPLDTYLFSGLWSSVAVAVLEPRGPLLWCFVCSVWLSPAVTFCPLAFLFWRYMAFLVSCLPILLAMDEVRRDVRRRFMPVFYRLVAISSHSAAYFVFGLDMGHCSLRDLLARVFPGPSEAGIHCLTLTLLWRYLCCRLDLHGAYWL